MGELINTKLSFIRCEKKKLAKKVRNQNKFDSMSEHYVHFKPFHSLFITIFILREVR